MTQHRIGFASFSEDNLLLGLLMNEARHGYHLYQEYQDTLSSIWQVGQSKFYAALNRLEDAGLLTSTTEDHLGRPARRVYAITAAGRRQFLDWVYRPVMPIRAIRVEFVAKLRFFQLLQLDSVERLLDAQIAACKEDLTQTQALRLRTADPVDRLTLRFRETQIEAHIIWLHECAATLNPDTDPIHA